MLPAPPTPPPRSFEIVARQIVAMVQTNYSVGQRLPAERDMARMFSVSRPTIREAILSLQMAGMLKVKNNSGAYVVSHHETPEVQTFQGFGPFENLQARQLIEPQIAALAAQHATAIKLAALAESLAAMRRDHALGNEADVADHRFHILLAESTGNGVLVSICDSLWRGQIESHIWQEIHNYMPMQDYRPIWLQDHEAIFRAVTERNAKHANTAMSRHLNNIRDALMAASNARTIGAHHKP
jgi:GntR family uxuAB operon transcriptional repressor